MGKNIINNIDVKKNEKVSSKDTNELTDSVEISANNTDNDKVNTYSAIAETDLQPRANLIDSATENISTGKYDNQEVINTTAEKIFEADIIADSFMDSEDIVREEKVEKAANNMNTDYYNNSDVLTKIADQLINVIK